MSDPDPLLSLSRRQRECLALVFAGLRSGEIAARLGLASPRVVDNYIREASKRTGISDRRLLARRLAEQDPEAVQKIVQSVHYQMKILAAEPVSAPDRPVSGSEQPANGWGEWLGLVLSSIPLPVPTRRRQWQDYPWWLKLTFMFAIAFFGLVTAATLVRFSHENLTALATQS